MYNYLKLKIKKNELRELLSDINPNSSQKCYISLFINQIDDDLEIVPLQSAYYFYNYFKHEAFSIDAIRDLFNKIFDISFDLFHKATKEFIDKDLEENISNGVYFLRCLEHRIECEEKLYRYYLKLQGFDFLKKIINV